MGVEATELGVEATEVGVEATEVRVEEATEEGMELAIGVVDMPVDAGTEDDSGPPEIKISDCRPIGRRTYLHS